MIVVGFSLISLIDAEFWNWLLCFETYLLFVSCDLDFAYCPRAYLISTSEVLTGPYFRVSLVTDFSLPIPSYS